jgi:peptidoglycan/xylan/chitin deacetylase (PgdA/CDA1 family)
MRSWSGSAIPKAATPGELSRGTYGPRRGLPRILALLERRGVPATFFLPALIFELHPEAVAAIRRGGRHGIGYHGYAHESVTSLAPEAERDALARGLALFHAAGVRPTSFRSASWDFSRATLGLIRDAGFRVDSSLMADDRPYELLADGEPSGIVELPVDWSLDDWPHFQLEWDGPLPVRSPDDVLALWRAELDAARSEGSAFVLTLHPQVIGRASRLAMLERLLDHADAAGTPGTPRWVRSPPRWRQSHTVPSGPPHPAGSRTQALRAVVEEALPTSSARRRARACW